MVHYRFLESDPISYKSHVLSNPYNLVVIIVITVLLPNGWTVLGAFYGSALIKNIRVPKELTHSLWGPG